MLAVPAVLVVLLGPGAGGALAARTHAGLGAAGGSAAWAPGDPTALDLTADPLVVAVSRQVSFAGRLSDPASGAGLSGLPVRLEVFAPETGTWDLVRDLVTSGDGALAASVTPARTASYRLHHVDPGGLGESTGPKLRVRLTELTAAYSRDAVRAGRPVEVTGTLVTDPGTVLHLERQEGDRWVPAGRTRTAVDQSYSFAVTPGAPGFWRWRVVRDACETCPASRRLVAALPRLDAFRMHTYSLRTRGLRTGGAAGKGGTAFRTAVAATYADPRGWIRAHDRFREVPTGGDFAVVLARAAYLPRFSRVCSTSYSCQTGRYVVVNASRWAHGSPYFTGTLETYRRYLVDHETGHWLGLGHASCPRPGAPAPVMQQQSKGMQGCRPNSWPLPREVRAVS
ncbi:MAG: DUF3152 domain-containing protein [Sporichthyaceae bacterium]